MFGRKRTQPDTSDTGDTGALDAVETPPKRDRFGSAMFYFLGPATVDDALQGHSPEARQAWRDLLANSQRARDEAKRDSR